MELIEKIITLFERYDLERSYNRYDRMAALNQYCVGFQFDERAYGPMREVFQNNDMVINNGHILLELLPAECFSYNIDTRAFYNNPLHNISYVGGDRSDILVALRHENDRDDMIVWWSPLSSNSYWEVDSCGILRLLGNGVRVYPLRDQDL